MPTFKKSKGKKGLFTKAQLQLALKSTLEDKASIRAAAIEFGQKISPCLTIGERKKLQGKTGLQLLSCGFVDFAKDQEIYLFVIQSRQAWLDQSDLIALLLLRSFAT